ncbi:RNA-binding S4 domain-containing protein [Kiloniella majae]|uniref:RNA-binding S4 domain-containing protein n=1 Tax=Kiloniella majae TaxID=1938558 RepID=UPI000A277138|nr:RNA-binding S4 domain-containing protein [Kiloniella majae]
MAGDEKASLRIDKWLWYARFFKTRSIASTVCNGGRVRVGGKAVGKASQLVKPDDVLTFTQGTNIRVVKILALGSRRGPAPEARELYEDLVPVDTQKSRKTNPVGDTAIRDMGTGRPTKKDRRDIDKLRQGDG